MVSKLSDTEPGASPPSCPTPASALEHSISTKDRAVPLGSEKKSRSPGAYLCAITVDQLAFRILCESIAIMK